MPLNLLVAGSRAHIEQLTPVLNGNGTNATFFLGNTTSSILRCLRSHPEINLLVVFGSILNNIDSFLARFQNTQGVRLVVVAGVSDDLTVIIDLCQKLEASDLYRTLFVYKPKNFRLLIRKSVTKVSAVSFQDKKKKVRWLNGHALSLGARAAMMFDIMIRAEGKIVLWQDLRPYFNQRATMKDAANRLYHEIKIQYPEAKQAFIKHRAVGVIFKPSLLPADKTVSAKS